MTQTIEGESQEVAGEGVKIGKNQATIKNYKSPNYDKTNENLSGNTSTKTDAKDSNLKNYIYELKTEYNFKCFNECKTPNILLMDSHKYDPSFKFRKQFEY